MNIIPKLLDTLSGLPYPKVVLALVAVLALVVLYLMAMAVFALLKKDSGKKPG